MIGIIKHNVIEYTVYCSKLVQDCDLHKCHNLQNASFFTFGKNNSNFFPAVCRIYDFESISLRSHTLAIFRAKNCHLVSSHFTPFLDLSFSELPTRSVSSHQPSRALRNRKEQLLVGGVLAIVSSLRGAILWPRRRSAKSAVMRRLRQKMASASSAENDAGAGFGLVSSWAQLVRPRTGVGKYCAAKVRKRFEGWKERGDAKETDRLTAPTSVHFSRHKMNPKDCCCFLTCFK